MPRPRVSTNLAISADGKITSAAGIASGWTSKEDHQRLLDLRKGVGALLIGRGTLEADRMTLTVPSSTIQPLRCVVSRSGNLDPNHPLFQTAGGPIHILITGEKADVPAEILPEVVLHRTDLESFLEILCTDYGVTSLHCEGGGELIGELAQRDLIDVFHLTLAGHTLFGGREARTPTGVPGDFLPRSTNFKIGRFDPRPETGECFIDYHRASLGNQ